MRSLILCSVLLLAGCSTLGDMLDAPLRDPEAPVEEPKVQDAITGFVGTAASALTGGNPAVGMGIAGAVAALLTAIPRKKKAEAGSA